ncbi:RNA polymerase sigma factor [Bacteroides sp. 224]|uniref:RNA polymerase sigma factor n=1 Tax=Bacteroides sp. 224 TaxID=2302936 RepID=UPI0013D569A5|nr:sigma-70 family RNA polymerase sigma factor [Bacteroides sp. 224]NDV64286.1 sigma-70 family RNA polymerase sigma factor [Bacteroides sp. 224]
MQELNFRRDVLPLKDKLFRLAYRITFDRSEAEDIVQDTMIRIWNKRGELNELESLEAYCLTVVKNLAIDRTQKKEFQNLRLDNDMENIFSVPDPYDKMVEKEKLILIDRLMNELPEKQRLIMQLRDVEGKSYKEIADILSLSEEQVKVNLFRARQKVKQRYNEIDKYGL